MRERTESFWNGGARVETWFRYAVKCDRDTVRRIEAVAQKAGISATTLVQQGFEAFCEGLGKSEPKRKPRGNYTESTTPQPGEHDRATRDGMTVGAMRVYRALAEVAIDGKAAIGVGSIARATGLTEGTVRVMLTKLAKAGRIERISAGSWNSPAVYTVNPLEPAE